jgi:type II secretory pathway component PulJ
MAISLVVSGAGWMFYRTQLRALGDQSAGLDAGESARAAIAFMAHEIRKAGYDPLKPAQTAFPTAGTTGISVAGSNSLQIQLDANSSGAIEANAVDPLAESITYAYNSTTQTLDRTVNGVTQTLISNVPAGGLSFAYYDANGNALSLSGNPAQLSASNRDAVATIQINLQVQTVRATSVRTVNLSARAAVRNRASVLARL